MASLVEASKERQPGEEGTEAATGPRERFSIDILAVIKDAQNQNGLRGAANFRRYRQYCTRRLRRIRKCKSIRFMYGPRSGRSFVQRQVTPDIVTDVRYLLIPLVSAERAWGFYRELKLENESGDEPRKFFHMKRRLAKAVKWARTLQQLTQECATDRTALEAQAYASWMEGHLCFESEDWQGAVSRYAVAQHIYTDLSKVGTLAQKELFAERAAEIEPPMKFCRFNIGLGQGLDVTQDHHASLLEMRLETTGSSGLQAKIDAVLGETRRKQASSMSSISWVGTEVPLRADALRQAIVKVQDITFNLGQIPSSNTGKREETYMQLFNAFDDASSSLRSEERRLKSKGDQKAATIQRELDLVRCYLKYHKLCLVIERMSDMADQLQSTLPRQAHRWMMSGESKTPASSKEDSANATPAKPEDLVKLYDTLMQYSDQILEIDGLSDDEKLVKRATALGVGFRALRCKFIALTKIASEEWSEAFALYDLSSRLAEDSIRQHQTRGTSDSAATSDVAKCISAMELLVADNRSELSLHAADWNLSNAKNSSVGVVTRTARPLLERLHDFDQGTTEHLNLISLPPKPRPMPPKPLFFDTVNKSIMFPDVSERVAETKETSGGFLSAVGNFFSS